MSDTGALVLVAGLVFAPVVLVLLAAILRGYTIDLHMTRDTRRGYRRRRGDNGDDEA